MINSPSKFTSLNRLKQIKQDNYIGELGKEYAQCEVDMLIIQKMQDKALMMSKMHDNPRCTFKPVRKTMDDFLKDFQSEFAWDYSNLKLRVRL